MDKFDCVVIELKVWDIRFPTSMGHHGSDAMHGEVDYSAAYVTLKTDSSDGIIGHGLTFTLGKGTDIVVKAIEVIRPRILGRNIKDVFQGFGKFWQEIVRDGQLRWLGPEKGVVHIAASAVFNALWDLWAKKENKPVWKLLADMSPEQILSLVDFSYITDAISKEEALEILKKNEATKQEREKILLEKGYPAYTTSVAWLGYSDEYLTKLCKEALEEGWTKFKVKVGASLEDDIRRCRIIREKIGPDMEMMVDANQRWDVKDAIEWMKNLTQFKLKWIEEPTSPDDVQGHRVIAEAMEPYGIGVATGECCQNRVMFKQFIRDGKIKYCQIDSCRLGSINENIAVLLMAKKYGVSVCPHAGGVGLCELVQHIIMFDYLCVSGTTEDRVCEYVDHLHEHFVDPVVIKNAAYTAPKDPGFSSEMKTESISDYEYPTGAVWQKLLKEGKFTL
uniref:mitochondrial enolase superfamily member 1-like n=1 Tax=Styela clava TaxID=7725 RepID=UPI00193A5033|nr:mitochondrial enolase superfamily member 1-like [Styela clava]